jgi:hypothetical protein
MATHAEGHPGWDRRRLVYGDWTWLVRDGLDVLRLVFLAGTVVFAIQGRSEAVALTAASAVLLIARVVDLPRWFDFGLIVAITLIAWGTALGLYGDWDHYDKVVHGLSPIGYAPVLYIALVRLGVVPDPERAIREQRVARISGIFIVTLAVGSRSAPSTRASSGWRTSSASSAGTSSRASGTRRPISSATSAARSSARCS